MKRSTIVFFPSWPDNPYHKLLARSLDKLGINVIQANGRRSFGKSFFFLRRVKWEWRADTFHIHSTFPFFNSGGVIKSFVWLLYSLVQLALLRVLGVRIVWTIHNLVNQEGRLKTADWFCSAMLANLAHSIIVHCDVASGIVARKYHVINRGKIAIIPHGNYIAEYPNEIHTMKARERLQIPSENRVLLFIGHIRPYKGVLDLVSKIKSAPPADSTLLIVGKVVDSDMEDVVRREIGDTSWIKFHPGYVEDCDVQKYLNACDAVVIPYRDIFTSGTIFLAMSFSRPCIAPKMGCIQETLNRDIAYLYDPGSKEGLIDAIHEACRDPERLRLMGQKCYQLAKDLDWARIGEMTREVYSGSNNSARKAPTVD